MEYCTSGRLGEISQRSWENLRIGSILFAGNYTVLTREQNENLIKLCREKEIIEIENKLKEYREMHEYEKFDLYFEKYIALV